MGVRDPYKAGELFEFTEKRPIWNDWIVTPERRLIKFPHRLFIWIRFVRQSSAVEAAGRPLRKIRTIRLYKIYLLEEMPIGSQSFKRWISPQSLDKALETAHTKHEDFMPLAIKEKDILTALYRHLGVIPDRRFKDGRRKN